VKIDTVQKKGSQVINTQTQEDEVIALTEQRNCAICSEDYSFDLTYQYEQCKHSYCIDCLSKYYSTCIMTGDVLSIGCPDNHCETEVTPEQIEAIVDADLFEKYKLFNYRAKMRLETDSRWCPKTDCNTIVKGDEDTLFCKCTNSDCGFEFCFSCSFEFHPGFTCEEIAKKNHIHKDYKRADKWKKKHKTKQCPQCRADIEKDKGCNHMTCASCQYQFCWLCMRKYTPDHYNLENFEGCPGRCFDIPKSVRRRRKLRKVAVATSTASAVVVIGLISLVLIIPVLIISAPVYGGYKACKHFKKK
jgi:hypothetical protein